MRKPTHLFRPTGKTNKDILVSLLQESSRILDEYETLSNRHSGDLQDYHTANPKNTDGESLESWVEKAALKLLFEQCEPENFDYEFHMLRKDFLDALDSEGSPKIGEVFVKLCALTRISGLMNTIMSARQGLEMAYHQPENSHEIPQINCDMMDFIELDVVNLRLYTAAREFYGPDAFLAMMEGSLSVQQPDG